VNRVGLAALAAWAAAAMAITFKLSDPRRNLGLVALEIAAADNVDKRGVLKTSYCILKIFWRCARETRETLIGVLI
jgi:hypothetical protein